VDRFLLKGCGGSAVTAMKKISWVAAIVVMVSIAGVVVRRSRSDGLVTATKPAAAASSSFVASRSGQHEWAHEPDPAGDLRLEGRVVDASGAGVAATVWLDSDPQRSVATEGDGSFAFDRIVGREYRLSAIAGNQMGGPVAYRLTADSDPVVIQLVEGAHLIVAVTNEAGAPVADASVQLDDAGAAPVKTDASGAVTVSPVPPGLASVEITTAGYTDAHVVAQVGSPGATKADAILIMRRYGLPSGASPRSMATRAATDRRSRGRASRGCRAGHAPPTTALGA
jgi:hypothetical protein